MVNNAVSLFAGIGGFELAMHNVGIPTIASCEIDPKAQQVLRTHFPNTHIFDDIKTLSGKNLINAGFKPETGIITAGFPCQDLSVAGKRAGLEGERSGLFWEIHRLLKETKTQNFILENVPGLLSSNNGRDMAIVIGSLVELGYGIAWRVLDAQHFGVPQRRRRVFIVGCLGDSGRTPAEILNLTEGRARYIETGGKAKERTTKNFDGVPTTVGTLLARDHKGLDQISVEENKAIVFYGNRVNDIRVQDEKVNTLQARMGTGGNNVPMLTYAFDEYNNSIADNHHTLRTNRQSNGTLTNNQVRRLTPIECERLQGFPDNWTTNQPDSHRYKQLGNAIAVPCVQWIMQGIITIG